MLIGNKRSRPAEGEICKMADSSKSESNSAVTKSHDNAGNAAPDAKEINELTQYVQTLLQQMQDKFQTMSDQIVARIDEMGGRIDELEKSIGELLNQAGVEEGEK